MPRLLYVSALPKASSGSGRAVRTAMVVDALRESYEVSFADPEHGPPVEAFDVVHVFRLAALQFAKPYLEIARARHLDLDDIESTTHRRIEALARANGHVEMADWELGESRRSELLETALLRSFDRIYVCSETDRTALQPKCRAELLVLPNTVPLPDPPTLPRRRDPSEPFRFLFLGTMGYYPNFDAYQWFRREVLRILMRKAPGPFAINFAGSGASERLRGNALIRIVGEVPDVRPLYEAAHAAIVPLRAGGGTRIKILEAFSYRVPVVSTAIGAEGIQVTPGVDILLGDTAEAFAARCVELMKDPALGERLAGQALRLVTQSYSAETLKRIASSPPMAPAR